MSRTRAIGIFAALAVSVGCAQAADYAGPVGDGSVWQGHFSGGRNLAPGVQPIPLDWVDVNARFASQRDCAAWVGELKRAYHTYEGFKSCLRIR